MTKITRKELHPSLIRLIEESTGTSGGKIVQKSNTVIINREASSVAIGIPQFDKNTDVLMVFKNSTYISEGEDYTISSNSTTINAVNGSWNQDNQEMTFNFIVFKNIPELTEEVDGRLLKDRSVSVTKLTDDLQNKINNPTITNLNGSVINDTSIHLTKLATDVQNKINNISNIKKEFITGYTGTMPEACFKIFSFDMERLSSNVQLTLELLSCENESRDQGNIEATLLFNNHESVMDNAIYINNLAHRYTNLQIFAKQASLNSTKVRWDVYARVESSHSKISVKIKNIYRANTTFDIFENSNPEAYKSVTASGTIIHQKMNNIIESANTEGNKAHYWAEICTVECQSVWQGASYCLEIMNNSSSDINISSARIYLRVMQGGSLGVSPIVKLMSTNNINLEKTNIKAIARYDNYRSIVTVYAKLVNAYETFLIKPIIDYDSGNLLKIADNRTALLQNLPTMGNLIECK